MTQRGESTLWGFVGGLLAGVLLASLYVRYGYQPRNVLTLPAQVTSAAVSMTAGADLENWDLSPEVRQRAAAVILSLNLDRLIELDDATDNVLTRELLRQKAVRAVQAARSRVHAYDMAVGKPALREALGVGTEPGRLVSSSGGCFSVTCRRIRFCTVISPGDFRMCSRRSISTSC